MAWVNEIYDTLYAPNTVCAAMISYGADSLAMLRAIKLLGLPLHRIIHTEVWATQTISADLPPMVEFKKKADEIILREYGIEVEHVCATRRASQSVNVEREREREHYEGQFYTVLQSGKYSGNIYGFPNTKGSWCHKLKYEKIDIRGYILSTLQGRNLYGFATRRRPYCTGELKQQVRIPDHPWGVVQKLPQASPTASRSPSTEDNGVRSSNSFLRAPMREGRRQISCSISASLRTSRCGSRDTS